MSDRSDLQRLLTSGDSQVVLRGRYDLDWKLEPPDWPFDLSGSGVESTELVFGGSDGLWAAKQTFYTNMPLAVRRLTLSTTGAGGIGLIVGFPEVGSVNEICVVLEELTIRPSPTTEKGRAFREGIVLRHAWNARLRDICIHGDNSQWNLSEPFLMKTGIALLGCQDAQLSGLTLYAAMDVGVLVEAQAVGQGEGLLLSQGAIVGARTCIKLDSSNVPYWTPWAAISQCHCFFHEVGVMLIGRSEAVISDCHICASAQTAGGVGVYIAGKSHDVKVQGNTFTTNSYKPGYGVVVDASEGALITGNTFLTFHGVWLTPSSRNCVVQGNRFGVGCKFPVIDQGQNNRVERVA